jgi:hypothetical protein
MLSADVAEQLRGALTARWDQPADSDGILADALDEAARDAKQRQLRPEELLLALKAIEEQVANSLARVDTEERDELRHWLVGACMRAYFNDPATGA